MSDTTLFLIITALFCLPLFLFLAAAGLPMASAALLFAPPKRVKVFRDKFGQQTATLCLLAGFLGLAFLFGFSFSRSNPAGISFWLAWPLPLLPMAGVVLAGLLALVYRATWQGFKNKRPLHALIGVAATLVAWTLAYFVVISFRHLAATGAASATTPMLFLPPLDSLAWYYLPLALALSLTLAGTAASLYLVLRRNKDDFGRDYYNYAVKLACKWALIFCLPALILHIGLAFRLKLATMALPNAALFLWSALAARVCLAVACLFWVLVLKSQNPLRLKFLCFCAALLVWMAIAGMAVGSVTYFLSS